MSKRIEDMTPEEQYRAYLRQHSGNNGSGKKHAPDGMEDTARIGRVTQKDVERDRRRRAAALDSAQKKQRRAPQAIPDEGLFSGSDDGLTRQEELLRQKRQKTSDEKKKDRPLIVIHRKKKKGGAPEDNDIPPKKGTAGKRGLRWVRRILIIAAVLIIALIGSLLHLTSYFERHDVGNTNFGISQTAADSLKHYRNVVILGSDARKEEGYDGSRTDAIIIMSLDKKSGDIRMISVMRDSYLQMKGYNSDEYTFSKATHAHAYGGAMNTISMLNRNLDLNIKEYMLFNWQAVGELVDALGGIDMNITQDEIADMNEHGPGTALNDGTTWKPITHTGVQTLDGTQAVTYCRIRKLSGGDTSRGNRYKEMAVAVIKKSIKHPLKIRKAASQVFPEIRTNMSQRQMLSLILTVPRMDFGESISWPKDYYGGIARFDGVWYAIPKTLRSNVIWLHKKAFGDSSYYPSSTCQDISSRIVSKTNVGRY